MKDRVVVVHGEEKFAALASVLDQTGFDDQVRERARELNVGLAKLRVAIKPNFMFMYSLADRSTFTDPELVLALCDRLRGLGCREIAIVEARSTYGIYFEGRTVQNVAEYIGYQRGDARYRVADLTEEMEPYDYGHRLRHHVAGRTWRDAQFRVSFAKNKTHTWAFYTLCIKNTYGALPMENKLVEYHEKREIEWPTIDALRAFPCHFGLIDAWLSADGQFGIFADKTPPHTRTILGGRNIVAVDWVGASKMGLDPMCSEFMRQAVAAFGKPDVEWIGDPSVYPHWRNVTKAMTEFWDAAEEHHLFTDTVLEAMDTMDAHFPARPRPWYVRMLRPLFAWLRWFVFKKVRLRGGRVRRAIEVAHSPGTPR
jgi:uncharacterized protein (DUF362 family)